MEHNKRRYADLGERILANSVLVHGDCWDWIGARKKASYYYYGQLSIYCKIKKKVITHYAHRVAYVFFTGREIPPGYEIDHTCHNTLCVNPAHLECKTRTDNLNNRRRYKRK